MRARFFAIAVAAAFAISGSATAQQQSFEASNAVEVGQAAVKSALRTVSDVLRDITSRHIDGPIRLQFGRVADRVDALDSGDLDEARRSIREALEALRELKQDLDDDEISDRLDEVIGRLNDAESALRDVEMGATRDGDGGGAAGSARDLDSESDRGSDSNRGTGGWLREGEYRDGRRVGDDRAGRRRDNDRRRSNDWQSDNARDGDDSDDAWTSDDDSDDRNDWRSRRDRRNQWDRWERSRFRDYAPSFVGDFSDRWPFHETGPYRPIPAVRYNRVDGLVLGVRRMPLDWDSYDRARIYGQGSYAFSLDRWRYAIGAEARLGDSFRENPVDFKIGGNYHRETATNDLWKATWAENSAGSFLFRFDSFDYFQTEGFTLYAVSRLTPMVQLSVAYRSDDYESLSRRTTWSLFGGDSFRENPGVRSGRMQSIVLTADGGRVTGMRYVPNGVAFRVETEFGKGMGGDFSFNRYVGDVRGFLRTSEDAGLAVRLRAGTSEGVLPFQKAFTLGGVGSIRAYPQNLFIGSKMLLANAEFTLYDVELLDGIFDDLAIFGLADAGWVGTKNGPDFSMDDVIPAAGFGIAFSDRHVRLELAWPLRDLGTGREATLWLRLNPTF